MNYVAAYYDVGSFRGAAAVCGTTPKTVKRAVARHLAGDTVNRPGTDGGPGYWISTSSVVAS